MKNDKAKEAPRPNSGAIYFEIDPRTDMIIVRGRWFGADGKAQALGFCKLPAWEQVPAAGTVMTQHLVRIVLDELRRKTEAEGGGLDNEVGDPDEDDEDDPEDEDDPGLTGDDDDDDDDTEDREAEVHRRILRGKQGETWDG